MVRRLRCALALAGEALRRQDTVNSVKCYLAFMNNGNWLIQEWRAHATLMLDINRTVLTAYGGLNM